MSRCHNECTTVRFLNSLESTLSHLKGCVPEVTIGHNWPFRQACSLAKLSYELLRGPFIPYICLVILFVMYTY